MTAIQLSDQRALQQTNTPNLRQLAPNDPRFANLRAMPEFQRALTSPPPPAPITIKRAGEVPFAVPTFGPGVTNSKPPLPIVPFVTITNSAGQTSAVPPVKK